MVVSARRRGFYDEMIPRLVMGRNFIETIILTLEQYVLRNPGLDSETYRAQRLEAEVCRFAGAYPVVERFYHDYIYERLEKEFPDLPRPEFRSCRVYSTLYDWIMDNHPEWSRLIKRGYGTREQWDEEVRKIVNEIVTDAVLATLTKLGFLS